MHAVDVGLAQLDGDPHDVDQLLLVSLGRLPARQLGFKRQQRVEIAVAIPDPRELGVGFRDLVVRVREEAGNREKRRDSLVGWGLQEGVVQLLFGGRLAGDGIPGGLDPEHREQRRLARSGSP